MRGISYVVEIERSEGDNATFRILFGPFDSMDSAKSWADSHGMAGDVRKLIREVHRADTSTVRIHPNQTTISDHIDDIHDHIG